MKNTAAHTPRLPDPAERIYRGPLDHPEVVAAKAALDEILAREKAEETRIAQARAQLRARALRRTIATAGAAEKATQLVKDLLDGGAILAKDPEAEIEAGELTLEILRPEKLKLHTAYQMALAQASFVNTREHTEVDMAVLEIIRRGMALIKEGVDTFFENRSQLLRAGNSACDAAHPALTPYALIVGDGIKEHDRMSDAFRANDARLKALGK